MSQLAVHNPYLGSRISLISKAKIRYEGILYAIDTDAMTVALTKVRSFGTENRCPDRPIGPRDEIFEYIIFRGTDICDLNVCDLPTDRFPQDPAILSATPVRPNDGAFPASQSPATQGGAAPPGAGADGDEKSNQTERTQRNQRNNQNYENRRQGGNQNNQRFQNQRNNQKSGGAAGGAGAGVAAGAAGAVKPEQYKEDFDFESANAEFETIRKELFENLKISTGDKEEKVEKVEEPESGEIIDDEEESTEYYNKTNSFFDNISCESTDPHGERITRSAERKLNSETFGIAGSNRGYNRRGGFNKRGGHRDNFGHRGGNRGGSRGGGGGRGGYRGGGNVGETRDWRSGHDNRAHNNENGNNQRGNWRNNNNQRGAWRHNNRGGGADGGNYRGGGGGGADGASYRGGGGGADGGNWRGGGHRNNHRGGGGGGGWGNKNRDESQQGGGNNQGNQGGRQNRNNRNREWVDYEYDVSKARQENNAQEA